MITEEEKENIERLLFSGELSSVRLGIEIGKSLNYDFSDLKGLCAQTYLNGESLYNIGFTKALVKLPTIIKESLTIKFNPMYVKNPNRFLSMCEYAHSIQLCGYGMTKFTYSLNSLNNLLLLDLSSNKFKEVPHLDIYHKNNFRVYIQM